MYGNILFAITSVFLWGAQASANNDINNGLPEFLFNKINVVNVDVTSIKAHLSIDNNLGRCKLTTSLVFDQAKSGSPMLDATDFPGTVYIDGKFTEFITIDHPTEIFSGSNTEHKRVGVLNENLSPGLHELKSINHCPYFYQDPSRAFGFSLSFYLVDISSVWHLSWY